MIYPIQLSLGIIFLVVLSSVSGLCGNLRSVANASGQIDIISRKLSSNFNISESHSQQHVSQYVQDFYDIIMKRAHGNDAKYSDLGGIHLIRVPKASSSSMSALARRIVGCQPPGPCCKYPGDPPGSCPSEGLFDCQTNKKVIGCTHHHPNYNYLTNPSIPSITMLREPVNRSISAYFYPGIHHNSQCKNNFDTCFLQYTSDLRWKNIAVKLLTGAYSYAATHVCARQSDCHNSLELAVSNIKKFKFIGIAEMWELSVLLLYIKIPTLKPLLSDFIGIEESSTESKTSSRLNVNKSYKLVKDFALTKYHKQLEDQNNFDRILYNHVVINMCEELINTGLWEYPVVQEYWKRKTPMLVDKCK